MKSTIGILGLLLLAGGAVWAAPETMQMYATLSAPIASFWEVKTSGNEPLEMKDENTFLNLWTKSGQNSTLTVTDNSAPVQFSINTLEMGKKTTLQIGNGTAETIWYVETLNIGNNGTADIAGDLLVKTLTLPDADSTVKIKNKLILGADIGSNDNITVPQATFVNISVETEGKKFTFQGSSAEQTKLASIEPETKIVYFTN